MVELKFKGKVVSIMPPLVFNNPEGKSVRDGNMTLVECLIQIEGEPLRWALEYVEGNLIFVAVLFQYSGTLDVKNAKKILLSRIGDRVLCVVDDLQTNATDAYAPEALVLSHFENLSQPILRRI